MVFRTCIFFLFSSMFFGMDLYGQNLKTKPDTNWNFDHTSPENSISESECCDIGNPDEMPIFPSEYGDYFTYFKNNIRVPVDSNYFAGTVFCQATIDTTGDIKDIIVKKGICSSYDTEAIRILSEMPNWIPGKQNGKKVNMKVIIRISFNSLYLKN